MRCRDMHAQAFNSSSRQCTQCVCICSPIFLVPVRAHVACKFCKQCPFISVLACRYDLPLLFMEMYSQAGLLLTGLAHPQHWQSPLGPFFQQFGAVPASPMSAYRALSRGRNVLLFPGALLTEGCPVRTQLSLPRRCAATLCAAAC